MAETRTLSKREKRFVLEYAIDLNATRAAIRAGYSPHSARQIGTELMARPEVKEAIEIEEAKRAKRLNLKADRYVKELELIAFSDLNHYGEIDSRGKLNLTPSEQYKPSVSRALKKISQSTSESCTNTGTSESVSSSIETHDKVKCLLELLARADRIAAASGPKEDEKPLTLAYALVPLPLQAAPQPLTATAEATNDE